MLEIKSDLRRVTFRKALIMFTFKGKCEEFILKKNFIGYELFKLCAPLALQ